MFLFVFLSILFFLFTKKRTAEEEGRGGEKKGLRKECEAERETIMTEEEK